MADQGSEGRLSPFLRRKRFQAAQPCMKGRILDFGCGSGALAEFVPSDCYLGVDIDDDSLQQARIRFPHHRFLSTLPSEKEKFDTIVALAVIEHVTNPAGLLKNLAVYLRESSSAHLIVTTPHPSFHWLHDVGAAFGIFSRHVSEEHKELLDRKEEAGVQAGLSLVWYRRFLLGANQIAVYRKAES
jgi:SAM-dependent methyltransferase